MDQGEMYIADGGYKDNRQFGNTPTGMNNAREKMKAVARAHDEIINSRIKQ
jgi:hypothetical protein